MEIDCGNAFIELDCQWKQLLAGYNWYTFNLINIEIENDIIMGGYECTFVLLGFSIRWRWNHTETEMMKGCLDTMKDLENDDEN